MPKNVFRVSDADAVSDFASLLARVRAGTEVIIEHGAHTIAIIHPCEPVKRTISECVAFLPEDSTAVVDPDFAKDVELAVESHREPLEPPAWD